MSDYDAPDAKEVSDKRSEEIAKEARERYATATAVDHKNREAQKDDTRFVWERGAQWPDAARDLRGDDKPCLEINQLPQFIKQVVNDQRQIRPAIRIRPGDGKASKETAEVFEGIVRGIQYESNADAIYDSAFEHAVTGGRGYWRIYTKYESEKSFNQVICLQRISDPLSVVMDTDYVEPDASDIRFCFVTEKMPKDEYKRRWPERVPTSWQDFDAKWIEGDDVIIADYYRIVCKPRKLALMVDGSSMWLDEIPQSVRSLPKEQRDRIIIRERESEDKSVEWYKIDGAGVIEEIEWPGKYIPVVMCVGDEIMVDGKRIYQGLIRRARDSQQMYNYWASKATELIALAPAAPWIGAEGQFEGYETMWQNANTTAQPYLTYKPVALNGTLAPPPQRNQFAAIPTGIVEQANQCKADLRATIGIYDPSLGNKSNEVSGKAIIARERQGDTATYHFVDNEARAIALTGRIIVDLAPKIIDGDRTMRSIAADGEESVVRVNEPIDPVNANSPLRNDLSKGEYAVVVDVGPSYATKRMEAADSMMQFVNAFPPAAQATGDLIAKSMDWPYAEEFAERMQLLLPANIQQAIAQKEDKQDPQVALLQQQLSEVTRQGHEAVQQLQGALQQATQAAADTQAQNEADLSKARTEAQKAKDDRVFEQEKLDLERDKIELDALFKLLCECKPEPVQQVNDADGTPIPQPEPNPADEQTAAELRTMILERIRQLQQRPRPMDRDMIAQALLAPKVRRLVIGPDGMPSHAIEEVAMQGNGEMRVQ